MIFPANSIEARRSRVQEVLKNKISSEDCVVIYAGEPISKPGGLDQCYPFLPLPTYYWLTGERRAGGAVCFSLKNGWKDFLVPISRDEIVWEGAAAIEFNSDSMENLNAYLKSNSFKNLIEIKPYSKFEENTLGFEIKKVIDRVRRKKDSYEVELIQNIAQIANEGFKKIKQVLVPGMTERELQLEYENAVLKAGAHTLPYETIVGSGRNAAVLHAIPTLKKIESQDLVLVDAGADVNDYCVDVTRVFPASGKFTSQQKDLYDLVLKAQTQSISLCREGVAWSKVHEASAKVISEGLLSFGVLKGNIDEILSEGASSVFLPHGVGHLVGLRVRDVGQEENIRPKKYNGSSLRIDLNLEENFLVTVEPGCYFISALLNDSQIRNQFDRFINWSEAEKWIPVGGVRIEDDILVGKNDSRNLTSCIEK